MLNFGGAEVGLKATLCCGGSEGNSTIFFPVACQFLALHGNFLKPVSCVSHVFHPIEKLRFLYFTYVNPLTFLLIVLEIAKGRLIALSL